MWEKLKLNLGLDMSDEFGKVWFEVSTDNFVEEILKKVSENPKLTYLASNSFIFCKKCNEVLLSPELSDKFARERIELYKKQGVWDKHWLHGCFFMVKCPKCGMEHYLALIIFRYSIKLPNETIWRHQTLTVLFPDFETMKQFEAELPKWAEDVEKRINDLLERGDGNE